MTWQLALKLPFGPSPHGMHSLFSQYVSFWQFLSASHAVGVGMHWSKRQASPLLQQVFDGPQVTVGQPVSVLVSQRPRGMLQT